MDCEPVKPLDADTKKGGVGDPCPAHEARSLLVADHTEYRLADTIIHRPIPTWRMVMILAWPVLLHQLLVFLVGLSDRYLAGHLPPAPGESTVAYQAAQTTSDYLSWFLSSCAILVSVGCTALVARFVGAGDGRNAIRVTSQAILLAVLIGVAATVAALPGMRLLIPLLQPNQDAATLSIAYLQPLILLLVFQMIEAAGISCLVGAGDTRTGLWILGGVAVLNVPLSWGLARGLGPFPQLGFPGIAWGTAISMTLGGLAVLLVLLRGRAGLRLHLRFLRPDGNLLWRLLRVGIPASLDTLSLIAGQLWYLGIINALGNVATSAHGIALRWEALAFLSGTAFGTAAMTLVGQNLGAGRPKQAARSGWIAFYMGCASMCALGTVALLLAESMFAVIAPGETEVIKQGVPVLRLIACVMPALACTIIFSSALRGAGDTRIPVIFTWVGFLLVRIPLAYLLTGDSLDRSILRDWLGCDPRLFGAWLAMAADLIVRGTFLLLRFAGGRWQRVRV